MVQYLVILLDDTSVSFCCYGNEKKQRRLMPLETLKAGILYGMKENLNIQFVFPGYELPPAHNEAIETVDHTKIKPLAMASGADVIVLDDMPKARDFASLQGEVCVLRLPKEELFGKVKALCRLTGTVLRLNVVITDADTFTDDDFVRYRDVLERMAGAVVDLYAEGKSPQLNLLTDRMMLEGMNNCGAGDISLTLAPDGCFYVCPAFYQSGNGYAVGSLADGLDIKNAQLYKLDHAPLCRQCDAYHCRRCIWLNRKATLEVNTPGHEQCVAAHLERNAARRLLLDMKKRGMFLPEAKEIKEIDYLDPFEVRKEW